MEKYRDADARAGRFLLQSATFYILWRIAYIIRSFLFLRRVYEASNGCIIDVRFLGESNRRGC